MSHTPDKLRNLIVMGHADSGKTCLTEAILHATGAIGRLGTIANGSTVTDWENEEKAKQHSIYTSIAHATHDGHELNLIDTPGYPDFFGETHAAAVGADIACIVINAKSGIGLNTRNAWKLAQKHGLARMIVLNKMDSDNVELERLVEKIREAFGSGCVWFSPPNGTGSSYSGNADGLAKDAEGREAIVDSAVETDEALMEKYLEAGEISDDDLAKGIAAGIRAGSLIPMVATAATHETGIKELLDVIVKYMPSPLAAKPREDVEGQPIDPAGPFLAQVFKVSVGDYGAQNFIRVFAGETEGNHPLHNQRTEKDDRVGDFQRPQGKGLDAVGKVVAGDIVIVPKVDSWKAGDTLTSGQATQILKPIEVPKPMVKLAVRPKTSADEAKMRPALDRIEHEDLAFQTERNDETHELLVKGQSMLHLETMLHRMLERTKVEVETSLPRIAYRETIRGKADARYRHKKQSGGSGEFGEVHIRLEPSERGAGFVFENAVVGGVVSAAYVPAVQKGIEEAMSRGVVAGYTFVDCRVILDDGKEHPVDSKEVAFKKAGAGAFKEAVQKAKPVILEPIMTVEVTVPEHFTGDIMGDMARRRSHPLGMEQGEGGLTTIKALIPEAEMQRYSQDLRSITSGEGAYAMEFAHYEFLPSDKAQTLIDEFKHPEDAGTSGRHTKTSGRH